MAVVLHCAKGNRCVGPFEKLSEAWVYWDYIDPKHEFYKPLLCRVPDDSELLSAASMRMKRDIKELNNGR